MALHWRPSYLALRETSGFASLAHTRFALFSFDLQSLSAGPAPSRSDSANVGDVQPALDTPLRVSWQQARFCAENVMNGLID
jgi:hypothetical protein